MPNLLSLVEEELKERIVSLGILSRFCCGKQFNLNICYDFFRLNEAFYSNDSPPLRSY